MGTRKNSRFAGLVLAVCAATAMPLVPAQEAATKAAPAGDAKSGETRVLEAGAKLLQSQAPLHNFDVYLVGFHPMKDRPAQQMEAHHYCHQVNEDFAQCVLFDGNDEQANMTGVEYIISQQSFESLPAEEKQYWHPHNAEILSGQLVAPGIPQPAEHLLMKKKMNSYGKTWHVWDTDKKMQASPALPMGKPMLAWSFNRDGEAAPGLVEKRDKALGINTAQTRKARADLRSLAQPQSGVDDLKGKFGRQTHDIPGVVDKRSASRSGAAASAR